MGIAGRTYRNRLRLVFDSDVFLVNVAPSTTIGDVAALLRSHFDRRHGNLAGISVTLPSRRPPGRPHDVPDVRHTHASSGGRPAGTRADARRNTALSAALAEKRQ